MERLLELAGKATPGDWQIDHHRGKKDAKPELLDSWGGWLVQAPGDARGHADLEFIFAAVNLVEPLARDWEQKRAALEEVARLADEFTAPNWYIAQSEIAKVARSALAAVSGEPDE